MKKKLFLPFVVLAVFALTTIATAEERWETAHWSFFSTGSGSGVDWDLTLKDAHSHHNFSIVRFEKYSLYDGIGLIMWKYLPSGRCLDYQGVAERIDGKLRRTRERWQIHNCGSGTPVLAKPRPDVIREVAGLGIEEIKVTHPELWREIEPYIRTILKGPKKPKK